MRKNNLLLILSIFLILSGISYSLDEDHVLINSKDWRDVYSSSLYANLNGDNSDFIMSAKHGKIILGIVPQNSKILVVSSRSDPYVKGYRSTIIASGYPEVEELITRNSNLDLANRLENINKFIIIDDAYGYNALSVASYAVLSKSYVLFANEDNIDDITNFFELRTINNLIIFGNVDRVVKDNLAIYNPEIINEGDRFADNLKIIDKYIELRPSANQIFLTNGEFIEDSLMSGQDPVIFIGKVNVPEQVRTYIKKSNFKVATLIGNELIGAAQYVKQQIGLPVFVKFAQGARTPTGGINQVEDLDRFPMPKYNLLMGIYEIKYNRATRNLEVTYENKVDLGTYFLTTITVRTADGEFIDGDADINFIDKGNYKTILYDFGDSGGLDINEGDSLTARVYTLFGESKNSLENVLEATYNISIVNIIDDSNIEINSLVYDKSSDEFIVEITNIGDVDVFVSPEIMDLLVNEEYLNYGVEKPIKILKGETKKIRISVDKLSEQDILENDLIRVKAYYGQRETALFKISFAEFAFQYKKSSYYVYVLVVVLLLLLLLLFSKKKCKNCGHKNKRSAKRCVKCHHKF